MSIDPEKLGSTIRQLRLARGMTQQHFADALSVTGNYISLLENGHRGITVPRLNEVAKVLNVPAAFITFLGTADTSMKNPDARLLMDKIRGLIEAAVRLDCK